MMKEERPHRTGEVTDAAHALMCGVEQQRSNDVLFNDAVMTNYSVAQ